MGVYSLKFRPEKQAKNIWNRYLQYFSVPEMAIEDVFHLFLIVCFIWFELFSRCSIFLSIYVSFLSMSHFSRSSQKGPSRQWGNQMFIHFHSFNGLVQGEIYRKAPYLMVKTMVSCNFSLKPIHFHSCQSHPDIGELGKGVHRIAVLAPGP